MKNDKMRIGFILVAMAVVGMTLLGGCASADPANSSTFLADLLRNAAAALLL